MLVTQVTVFDKEGNRSRVLPLLTADLGDAGNSGKSGGGEPERSEELPRRTANEETPWHW